MSKSPLHEPSGDIYPIHTDVFQAFISQNNFAAKELNEDHTVAKYEKKGIVLLIPFKENLSKGQVENLLNRANIPLTEFEHFVETSRSTDIFNMLIDASRIKTPPKH